LDRFPFDQFGRETASDNLARIRCPLLVVVGANEAHVAAPEDLAAIRRHAVAAPHVETQVIEGADHFYAAHEAEVAALAAHWAAALGQEVAPA
jgi:pimeloyl-ACP methyl ester carboxylesterase